MHHGIHTILINICTLDERTDDTNFIRIAAEKIDLLKSFVLTFRLCMMETCEYTRYRLQDGRERIVVSELSGHVQMNGDLVQRFRHQLTQTTSQMQDGLPHDAQV